MFKIARLVRRSVTPQFEHDCSNCRFLGRLDGEDLYVCENGDFSCRYGSNPASYGSLGGMTPVGSPYSLALVLARTAVDTNEYRSEVWTEKDRGPQESV